MFVLLSLHSPSQLTPRIHSRTDCRTAGQIFFRYFATERGINHFLSRHLRWTDSVIFGSKPVVPLSPQAQALVPSYATTPIEVGSSPNYAPSISPCPEGPIVRSLSPIAFECSDERFPALNLVLQRRRLYPPYSQNSSLPRRLRVYDGQELDRDAWYGTCCVTDQTVVGQGGGRGHT